MIKGGQDIIKYLKMMKIVFKHICFIKMVFCTFCGAIRSSGQIGVGCEKIVKRFLEGYINEFVELPQQYKDDYLNAYKKYVRYARALYLYHYTKKGKMKTVKAFKIEFKKSFTQRMIDNS